jgi:hypothetical protein
LFNLSGIFWERNDIYFEDRMNFWIEIQRLLNIKSLKKDYQKIWKVDEFQGVKIISVVEGKRELNWWKQLIKLLREIWKELLCLIDHQL